ncbi:rhomboid family intramembrane serine protease [Massilia solisilvae]|uniref:Rhomboid family intramembrane serine protease n=1 Tax=Massilia solisilvae TaxID=1811225 RepID=A0ABT2BPU1_9BURK|nr:rhomboid family intramembrane serine protease [Massilia solisilvae]MCS0610532.1 rhomboid family intramembrane serine protease [Massilia solisilvae]
MTAGETFEVRFRAGGRRRAGNPYQFNGKGSVTIEPDFLVLRGTRYRNLRAAEPEEHRLKMVDIVNVRSDGKEVEFEVVGVERDQTVAFDVPDEVNAWRIFELLPVRQTEEFRIAQSDRETFHDRIDHWTPRTPVIWALLAMNILVFVLMSLSSSGDGSAAAESMKLVRWGSNAGPLTLHGQPWRLVTSMFVHGGLLHILFNMFALWQVGRLVERMFGSARFLALYMIAGVCGSLASVLWNPHVNSVGASGAIFGIIGGLLAFMQRPDSGVPATIVRDLRGSLGGFLMFNIAAGLVYPHTDNAAHIGGLAGGYLAGLLLARSLYVPDQRR